MADSSKKGRIPCVEQPELEAFDTDGDGIVSFAELRARLSDNPQVVQVLTKLEEIGVVGIRYAGCNDVAGDMPVANNGAYEDLARLIARAAVNEIYKSDK